MGRQTEDAEVVDTRTGEIPEGAGVALAHRDEPTAAARRQVGGLLEPVANVGRIMEHQRQIRELVANALVPGKDYGAVPGTDSKSLWQPGADVVAATFGVMPQFRILEAEVEHDREVRWTKDKWVGQSGKRRKTTVEGTSIGLYRYVVACELVHRASGVIVGEGIGACSSLEPKYCDRPRALEHTILKLARKRAYVDSILLTFQLHDLFGGDPEGETTTGSDGRGNSEGEKPAGADLRDALEELARDDRCPPEIGTFINRWLAKGDALTVEKARWTLEQARLKMDAADEYGDSELPF